MSLLPPARPAPDVRHYVAGGREHGGGIGRLVGYVLDAQPPGGRQTVCDTRGPRFRPLPSAWHLAAALAGLAAARVSAPDRLHQLHVAGRGSTLRKLILARAARALGCRYLLHLHDYDYAADLLRRPAWQQAAVRRMFHGAERVIVLGDRDRATVTGRLGVPADRVRVLRNCVPDPGTHAPHPAGPVRMVFLGRLCPRKGVPELIAALASPGMTALAGRAPGWRAVLAGDGPVQRYRAEAERLGLSGRVTFPGWLDEAATRQLCREADILVLPSHAEGLAMAVLEGLAHGLAVVTTPVGAHPEVLTDGKTCVLVPPGDAAALAETLSRLIGDPGERARLGQAGRSLYTREFGIDSYLRRLTRLQAGTPAGAPIALDSA